MSTSDNKIVNKRSSNKIERQIFEKGLRITQVVPVKKQDSLIVFLSNSQKISVSLSSFPLLKKATQTQLDSWKLISKGVGITWSELDEDLSLKGLIIQFMLERTLQLISSKPGDPSYAMAA